MAIVEIGKGIDVVRTWPGMGLKQEQRPIAIVPEQELRRQVIDLLHDTPVDKFNPLTSPYAQFGIYPTGEGLKQSFINGVNSAQRSTQWSNKEEGVQMGFYNSETSFYTHLFHEITHRTLTTLGRDLVIYHANPLPEEEFCWQSSQAMSRLLDLPFASQEADVSIAIAKERLKGDRSSRSVSRIDLLGRKEREVRGITDYSREKVVWTPEGIPQLAA